VGSGAFDRSMGWAALERRVGTEGLFVSMDLIEVLQVGFSGGAVRLARNWEQFRSFMRSRERGATSNPTGLRRAGRSDINAFCWRDQAA